MMSTLLYFVVVSMGIIWHRAQRCCLYILREGGCHCILNDMQVMKSAVLFVDNMEISWHRVQESHCTRQQNTTHLDHTERQLRGSYCYGFDNNGDDIYHICNNAEIFEQKHTWVVKKGNGA